MRAADFFERLEKSLGWLDSDKEEDGESHAFELVDSAQPMLDGLEGIRRRLEQTMKSEDADVIMSAIAESIAKGIRDGA